MASADDYIEIVEVVGGRVVYDEMAELAQCASCGHPVSAEWAHCPACGEELGGVGGTCEDVGRMGVFVCSECGGTYLPAQLSPDGVSGDPEWNCCPKCTRLVRHVED